MRWWLQVSWRPYWYWAWYFSQNNMERTILASEEQRRKQQRPKYSRPALHPSSFTVQSLEPQVSSVRSVLRAHKQKCSEWTKTYHGKVVQLMRRSNGSAPIPPGLLRGKSKNGVLKRAGQQYLMWWMGAGQQSFETIFFVFSKICLFLH